MNLDSNGDPAPRRAGNGRFLPGHHFGRGNPHCKRMHRLRSALLAAITRDDIRAAGRKLAEAAAGGDIQAIKVLFDYTLGKPPQAVELTGSAGAPLELKLAHLESTVLAALDRFPEARAAVALSLRSLSREDDRHEPGSAGPEA